MENLETEMQKAIRNAKRQRRKELLGINTRTSSKFWYQVARDYSREISKQTIK